MLQITLTVIETEKYYQLNNRKIKLTEKYFFIVSLFQCSLTSVIQQVAPYYTIPLDSLVILYLFTSNCKQGVGGHFEQSNLLPSGQPFVQNH